MRWYWDAILAVAFALGLWIVATTYVIGGVSGCHINPAVSFAMLIAKNKTRFLNDVKMFLAQVFFF